MQKLLIATTNKGKLGEIKEYLSDLSLEFVSLTDCGITKEMEETGKTYEENSQAKALFYSKLSGFPAISDDGGLEIDALGGAPGIDSHYFAGRNGKDEDIVDKMLEVAKNLPDNNRKAIFRAVVSLALPNGKVWSKEGKIKGIIAKEPKYPILKGFPYRSFFFLPEIGKYCHSKLTKQEEKAYNHRYKAMLKLKPIITRLLINKVQNS